MSRPTHSCPSPKVVRGRAYGFHRCLPTARAPQRSLFADYFQIHVLDDDSEATETGIGDVWTEQAILDGLGVAEHALAIGTAVNETDGT
jgi:hypothetical protein